ncbi:MAG: ribulose 1,5-bisphosphate carboxylase, partial [Methanobacteriota archaeon]
MIREEEVVVATYYMESALDLEDVARATAGEQSTGTWTKTCFETEDVILSHGAQVIEVETEETGEVNKGIVKIGFPIKNFGPVVPMLLTTVAGNLFEMADLRNVKLLDLDFPSSYLKEFRGPKFGIAGTRKAVGVSDRPLIGCIVKPCVGLKPKTFAEACYQVAVGGVDFIKDDELISNPGYSAIEDRTARVMEALDRAEEETGEKTLYAVNVTDEVTRIMDNAEAALSNGANCLMINFVTAGFSALRMLAEDPSIKVPIHCHRDMFGSFSRSPVHGISTIVVSKLTRLCGGDQIHAGAIDGKLYESNESVVSSAKVMRERWNGIEPSLPVSSGGQNPCKVKRNLDLLGKDVLILAGGGIFGHRNGATAGAKAMRQALDLALQGVELKECPSENRELRAAIDQWGK